MNKILKQFPATRSKWKTYYKVFLPMVLGSMMFALNGVVDNFMVGGINQGQSALGAINSWGGILMGFFIGTAAAGSVAMAQFYHADRLDIVKQVSRIRFILSIAAALTFAAIAWGNADVLAKVFLTKGTGTKADVNYLAAMEHARTYAHIIGLQWLLMAFSFNYGNQLRELGHPRVTMFWGMGTLTANIALNSILMYGFGMGVEGAAWASVAGRLVAITTGIVYITKKKLPISLNVFMYWKSTKVAWKIFLKRWVYSMAIFTGTTFVVFRSFFYSRGLPVGSLGRGVSGMSVVALTGALINVFTVIFNSLASMGANFVGSELGKNNLKQARINSDELRGFNTLNAVIFSLMLVVLSFLIPYMTFLSHAPEAEMDNHMQLMQVSHALLVVALFLPLWIWFSTSYRNAATGGKGSWFAIVDWGVSLIQLGWLAIIMFVFPHQQGGLFATEFWASYLVFFASDILKLIGSEILYHKYPWAQNITKEVSTIEKEITTDGLIRDTNEM